MINPLTGTLHFTHVELTDGNAQLPGKCRDYGCALTNRMFRTIFLGHSHCIVPVSGTVVIIVKQVDAVVFVILTLN